MSDTREICGQCWFGECGGIKGDHPRTETCHCCRADHHGRRYCDTCHSWHVPDEDHRPD